jgi:hypothetical protein
MGNNIKHFCKEAKDNRLSCVLAQRQLKLLSNATFLPKMIFYQV